MIKLGYELENGKEVKIRPSHLIVCGVTQLSGKTTTLEALIKRSGLKAIVFKTKIGEKSFTEGQEITPFFRDRSDYEFVSSLIEAYSKEKLIIEKGTLMTLCKGSNSLLEIKKRVDETIVNEKLRGIKEEIYTRLQHYLENLIPQIQYANLSKVLTIYEGINIMNLERFSEEVQSLIIQSVASEVLNTMREVIMVIPEAWKFLPQKYKNPCKRAVEAFIRQGATNQNFIWIDSQDMAGVDKIPLKQISTWILGYQSERNEVKHTLDQISLPKKSKPSEDEIMNLKTGHFILSSYEGVRRVYVQPSWMEDETAERIAKGELSVDDIEAPLSIVPLQIRQDKSVPEIRFDDSKIRKQINELRIDFFNKIQEIQIAIQKAYEEIYHLKSLHQNIDIDEIVSLVMQKTPVSQNIAKVSSSIDEESLIKRVLARVPKGGSITYEVAPLEKIKKEFLEEAKKKIIDDINKLDENQKKLLKWIEQKGKNANRKELYSNALNKSWTGGEKYKNANNLLLEMNNMNLLRIDTANRIFTNLKNRIQSEIGQYEATEQEIENVYNHILAEML